MSALSEPTKTRQSRDPQPPQPPMNAVGATNPHGDPAAYLLEKGWRCLGNPSWESSHWLDPMQPLVSSYTEEPCMYEVEMRDEYVEDGKVKVRYKKEMRQVLAQDGRGGGGQAARRYVYHPKVKPMGLSDALMAQLERDAAETLRAEESRRKSEEGARK